MSLLWRIDAMPSLARILFPLIPAVVFSQTQTSLAPTPPMGWNSWDLYGLTVTESEFKANADWMAHNLKSHGWEYAVVDEGWYLENPEAKPGGFHFVIDANGRYIPAANRFPSAQSGAGFKSLARNVHSLGLKFGIHIIRGIPREAVSKNLPIAGSSFHARDAADTSDTCPWNQDNYGVKSSAAGQAFYDSLAQLYASWGVDFVKVDCIASHPYKADEIRMFSQALAKTGRPIVLSLSPGPAPLDKAAELAKYAQMWRISDDVWDHWGVLPHQEWSQGVRGQFALAAQWAPHVIPGHWPDADMLPIGYLGPRPGLGTARQTALTHDEERTLITLWCIFRSPLILGANLTRNDDWTDSLLTNDEVIAVDQHSSGGRAVIGDSKRAVWVAKAETGRKLYIALFNLADSRQTMQFPLQSLGLGTAFQLRDLWQRKDAGKTDLIEVVLQPHASALFSATTF